MPHVKAHAARAQASQPGAQQRRGLQVERKYAAGRADEGFDAEPARPCAQRVRVELREPARDFGATRAVARDECVERFGMREIEPALAGDQELAADRTEAIVDIDFGAGRARDFGRHQAGRAAADDRDRGGVLSACGDALQPPTCAIQSCRL